MKIVIERYSDINEDLLFIAYPEGEPDCGLIGTSADALYETIDDMGLDELRHLSKESRRYAEGDR